MAESNLVGLRKEFGTAQTLRTKAESSLQCSLQKLEKIRTGFEMEKKIETEKAALIQRAEDTENQLALVTEELAGLKASYCSNDPGHIW